MTSTHIDVATVDFDALGAWMDAQGLPGGPITGAAPVLGGTQNVMIRFERGGRPYILRRPPVHARRKSNEVLRRESRVLAALRGTQVPAPRLVAAQTEREPVFYLMEPVDGFNPSTGLPEPHASDPAIRHRMGLEAAAALAELGRVDPAVLPGFGSTRGLPRTAGAALAQGARLVRRARRLSGPRHPRTARDGRLAHPAPAAHVHAGHHARRLPLREPHVRLRRPPRGRDRGLGDVHDRRPAARPGLAAGHVAEQQRSRAGAAGCRGRSSRTTRRCRSATCRPSAGTR